jgi:hypothetical protein
MAKKTEEDIVFFLTPDGRKVSNDPRFRPDEEDEFIDDPNTTAQHYSQWDGKQLKAEVARRNEGRMEAEQIKLEKGMRKSDVVALLEADDQRGGAAPGSPIPGSQQTANDGSADEE